MDYLLKLGCSADNLINCVPSALRDEYRFDVPGEFRFVGRVHDERNDSLVVVLGDGESIRLVAIGYDEQYPDPMMPSVSQIRGKYRVYGRLDAYCPECEAYLGGSEGKHWDHCPKHGCALSKHIS